MKPETKRLIAAVFGAPLALASVWGLIGLVADGARTALFFSLYALYVGFLITLLFGIPTHIALKKSKQFDLRSYLIAGAVIALVPVTAMVISIFNNSGITWQLPALLAAFIIPSALFTAGIAWAIARPDRSEAALAFKQL